MKKLIAVLVGALILSSGSAFASDKHHCKEGTHWDSKKAMCVADEKKN